MRPAQAFGDPLPVVPRGPKSWVFARTVMSQTSLPRARPTVIGLSYYSRPGNCDQGFLPRKDRKDATLAGSPGV